MSHIRSLLLATALLAPAAATADPAFSPGEEMHFRVEALGMKAGKARLQVQDATGRDGVAAWPIVIEARTDSLFDAVYPVDDRFVTFWDPATSRVVGADFYENEAGKRSRWRASLDHDSGRAEVKRIKDDGSRRHREYAVPAGVFDIAGALMALRLQPMAVGQVIELPVFTFKKTFTLRCEVVGVERITTEAGTFEAFATRITMGFDGKLSQKRDLLAWFSTDARRLPLRFDADLALGTVQVTLARHRPGAGAVAAR